MDMRLASPQEVAGSAVRALGLEEASLDIFSPEALAAALRRAASFLCPATPGQIVRSVSDVLIGLPGWGEETVPELKATMRALVGYGDLVELRSGAFGERARQVFLGAPAFVRRASGMCLLIGVRPDGAPLIAGELATMIAHEGHTRLVRPTGAVAVAEMLISADLAEITPSQWLQPPRRLSAAQLVEEHIRRLEAAGPSGDTEGFRLIDPSVRVTFYRGRWRQPTRDDDGHFVGRRPQAYGADLWCFAHVSAGKVRKLIDFPVGVSVAPAADEAWRLQAALDAAAGHPQRVRMRSSPGSGVVVIDFMSPIPSWAQRRLDIIGTPMLRSSGALFSYRVRREDAAEELEFLAAMLWISSTDGLEENDVR
jgi:hypothetical protein